MPAQSLSVGFQPENIIDDHFQRLAHWLDLESAAEAQRLAARRQRTRNADAEKSGESLLDLAIVDQHTGLAGRQLVTFVKRNRTLRMPWHRLRVGSPVILTPLNTVDDELYQGVVSGRQDDSIQVAVAEWPQGESFRLDLSPDEITRKRQKVALFEVKNATGRLGTLRRIILGERPPQFCHAPVTKFFDVLNPSQCEAVEFALSASDLAVIHGPPGTGKTTTVVELIRQAVLREQKVLACAPSNTAVDNLLQRLVAADVNVVRLGHPARVTEDLREHVLDLCVENHDSRPVIEDMLREAENLFRKAGRFTRAKPARGEKQELRREAKRLKSDVRRLEKQAVHHVLDRAEVICSTTSLDTELLGDRQFDLVVIDEACQCTEPAAWVPMLNSYRVVLAGDHCQLPPTVVSKQAAEEGLGRSLLERVIDLYGSTMTRRLIEQYRMHDQIMQFSSEQFYDGELQAHDSVAKHRLSDLPLVAENELTREPVLFVDTAGAGWDEELEPDGESKRNLEEARLVLRKVAELNEAGLDNANIAVIAPYAAQVRWLKEQVSDRRLEIDTVDGFQGREKEAVIITFVRSNNRNEIGFLADTRRTNVALTRARRKLIVIGDSATLGGHDFYRELIEYFESIGAYRSVWEEM